MADSSNSESSISNADILIVEDETFVREAMELYLLTEGFTVHSASCGEEALCLLKELESADIHLDVAVLDILMPGMTGIELLHEIKKRLPDLEVIIASGCGTVESAVQAMRMGAYDYVQKPILDFEEDLLRVLHRALEKRKLVSANRQLSVHLQEVNRHLHANNKLLTKSLTTFELLHESGRLLAEFDSLADISNFAKNTLLHQIGIPRAALVLHGAQAHQLVFSMGFEDEELTADEQQLNKLGLVLNQPDELEEYILDSEALSALSSVIHPSKNEAISGVAYPLRVTGELHGTLLVLADCDEACSSLLRIFATQLSYPIALVQLGVSQ